MPGGLAIWHKLKIVGYYHYVPCSMYRGKRGYRKLTSVLFFQGPLAQYGDGKLEGEHTNVASSLAKRGSREQKHQHRSY